ncbi:MAG: ankyrin repeat domain-containing protein [Balneolaceae bacterium]
MKKPTVTDQEEKRYTELQQIALDFARAGETIGLKKMIDAGLPVDLADEKGQTLLMLSSYHGRKETARMLLESGADPDRRNDRGQTPLGGTAFKGYTEIAGLLLEAGADIDADNGGGISPIHYAAMFGRWDVVELFEQHGASLKRDPNSRRGGILLMIARITGILRKKVAGLFKA